MGRKKIHTEESGVLLLDAAEALLEEAGLHAVTVRAVAQKAGVTTRAVYAVFGDMDGLTGALSARGYGVLSTKLKQVRQTPDPRSDLIRLGIDGFRAFALERPHLFRLTFERLVPGAMERAEVLAAATEGYSLLMSFIIRAQENGIGAHLSRSLFVISYHATCQGLASVELSHQPPPIGGGFWQPLEGKDPIELWTVALGAMIDGLVVPNSS